MSECDACREARVRLAQLLATASTDVEEKSRVAQHAFPPTGSIQALRLAQLYRDGIARCVEELEHVGG